MAWIANAVSPIGVETPESARATDSFSIDAQTTGSKGANLFTGFTNPAINIAVGQAGYNGTGHKYAKAVDNSATFVTTYSCRDAEITARMAAGALSLRFDSSTGAAVSVRFGASGDYLIGQQLSGANLTDVNSLNVFGAGLSGNLSEVGWTGLDDTDIYTFGIVGFDGYFKRNGVTVRTWKEFTQTGAGRCVIWPQGAYDGVSDASVAYIPGSVIGSNRAKNLFDIRDLGAKPSTVKTTGSMSAGSNALNVASASGFGVGDSIIVEIGGETGLGRRGTEGVGGAWPYLNYADATAMNADASQSNGVYCWLRSTGGVYQREAGAWTNSFASSRLYYVQKALPKALLATITAIAGNVLTLSKPAVVSTSGANVYIDASTAFAPISSSRLTPYGMKLQVPPGLTFALGTAVQQNTAHTRDGMTLMGGGTVFSPKGTACVQFGMGQQDYVTYRDITTIGNHVVGTSGEVDGFLFTGMEGNVSTGVSYPYGFVIGLSNYSVMQDLTAINVVTQAFNLNICKNTWGRRLKVQHDYSHQDYIGWMVQGSNCLGGGFLDCVTTSPVLVKTYEGFACYPSNETGVGFQIINCGGTNCLFSTNSSRGMKLLEPYCTVTTDAYQNLNAGSMSEGVLQLGSNAFHTSLDVYVRNPWIIQTGYARSSDSSTMRTMINISPDGDGVIIEGQYAGGTSPYSTSLGGYLACLVPWSSGSSQNASDAIIDQGANTILRGIRAVGTTNPASNIINNNGGPTWAAGTGTSTVQDCIADGFGLRVGTTKSGNRTNAGVAVP